MRLLESDGLFFLAFTGRVRLFRSWQYFVYMLWGVDRRWSGVCGNQQLWDGHQRRLQSRCRLCTQRAWWCESLTVIDKWVLDSRIFITHPSFIFTLDLMLPQNTCVCKTGYMGDGKVCDRVNPCTVNYGGCHQLVRGHHSHTLFSPHSSLVVRLFEFAIVEFLHNKILEWLESVKMVKQSNVCFFW